MFYSAHVSSGAKLIDFGGFEMPVQYEGIKAEHNSVRSSVGIFDVSHMGEFFIEGPEALDFINKITINDASKLSPGRAQYSAMCYKDGGIVDDLLVYMLNEERYMLVVNASNIDKDFNWIRQHHSHQCSINNLSDDYSLIALQGPNSANILQKLVSVNVFDIGFYRFKIGDFVGINDVIISETGYTGEKGYELYFKHTDVNCDEVWNTLLTTGKDYGLKPCGLGARDTLRLEMGYALYGNDITHETNPLEAGLGWLTKMEKGDFIGKSSIETVKSNGLTRKLIGFVLNEKGLPRHGYPLSDADGNELGFVTSGGLSVTMEKGIGLGYCSLPYAKESSEIYVKIREKLIRATITKPPFVNTRK